MPRRIDAGVNGQPVEPGIEPVGVAQPGQVPPGSHHGLLDRVARELRVPEDETGGRVQPRDGRVDEHAEGVMIAPACPLDETSLVHGRPSMRRDARSRSYGMTSPATETLQTLPMRAILRVD